MRYIMLYPYIALVEGKDTGALYDLLNRKVIEIEHGEFNLLKQAQRGTSIDELYGCNLSDIHRLRLTALMTAILVAFSNCDFKEEKKQNFVEPLLSTPFPVFLIVCCRFLVVIFYWIVFSAMNMGLVYLLNVNLFGNEGFYVIMDIAYYLVILFLGIVMSLSVWNNNLLPKMTSSFVSLGVLILGITSAFNNISMTLIIGVIMLLLAFGGIITFLFTYNKENLIGD